MSKHVSSPHIYFTVSVKILLEFLWQIEKLCPELDLRPWFISELTLNRITIGLHCMAKLYHKIK